MIVKCQKPQYIFYSAIPQSVGGTTSTEKHRKYHSYKAGILVDAAMEYFLSEMCKTTLTILSFRIDSCNELWYNMYKNLGKINRNILNSTKHMGI